MSKSQELLEEIANLLDEGKKPKKEEPEKEKKDSKYSVKVPGKEDVPADTLDDAIKVIEPVAKKSAVEVTHAKTGKKIAYGPKGIAKAVLVSRKARGEK